MGEENQGDKVRVVDRRWFTPEGELREPLSAQTTTQESASEQTAPQPPETPQPPPTQEAAQAPPPVRLPQRVVLDLIDFLAQYAMAFLTGQIPELGCNPAAARMFIDLIAEVQKRTSGELSPQEAKVLEDVLFQLRAQFIGAR